MKPHIGNIGLGIGLMVFFGYVLLVLIPAEIFVPAGIKIRALSPAFFPKIIVILLIGLGGGMVVQALLSRKTVRSAKEFACEQREAGSQEDEGLEFPLAVKLAKIGAAILLLFSYYWLIGIFGMLATSVFMMPLFAFLYGNRNWKLVLPISIVLAVSLYYFFVEVASISIPKGSLFG